MTDIRSKCVILQELLESSSSDEDDELLQFLCDRQEIPKVKHFIEDVVYQFSDVEFKKNFRLQRNTCEKLINGFQNSSSYPQVDNHGGSKKISPETYVLCFLWFAGNKCCLRDVAQRFGIGITSAFRGIERVVDYLNSIAKYHITFPNTSEDKVAMSNKFLQISGFPNVIGCIDATSIPVRTPAKKIKSTYVNRHDLPSITLQGICDHNRKFLDVFVGAPGKIHDSRVFKLSFISQKLPELCENRYHLLGDGAYAIREWLLTPYKNYGNLTQQESFYNKKFSATRVLIENSFGLLKGRFRQLQQLDMHKVDKITKFIVACCVAHNLCIDNGDVLEEEWFVENYNQGDDVEIVEMGTEKQQKELGQMKRDYIKNKLSHAIIQ